MYVQMIPHDRFTKLVPYYEYEEREMDCAREKLMAGLFFEDSGSVFATLTMPQLTPYREPFIGE